MKELLLSSDVLSAAQVIDLILLYDGDVMKFAGDSMIVAFSPSNEEKTAEDGGLKEATLRCMHCASDLVDKYGKHSSCKLQNSPCDALLHLLSSLCRW